MKRAAAFCGQYIVSVVSRGYLLTHAGEPTNKQNNNKQTLHRWYIYIFIYICRNIYIYIIHTLRINIPALKLKHTTKKQQQKSPKKNYERKKNVTFINNRNNNKNAKNYLGNQKKEKKMQRNRTLKIHKPLHIYYTIHNININTKDVCFSCVHKLCRVLNGKCGVSCVHLAQVLSVWWCNLKTFIAVCFSSAAEAAVCSVPPLRVPPSTSSQILCRTTQHTHSFTQI